jgi:hypothetical protein
VFHLFNSAVRVERLQLVVTGGVAVMDYAQATDEDPAVDDMLKFLKCRLDMNFIREGKDLPPAPVAGKAPDRIGVLFTFPYAPIKAGDRIVAIENEQGKIPVAGTFEIRAIPDEAIDFADRHHIEVQIIETNQELEGQWPAEEPLPDEEPVP